MIVARFDPEGQGDPSASYRANFLHDWGVGHLTVVHDDGAAAATTYGVRRFPATFVIDEHGVLQDRWDRLVPAYRLAASIEAMLPRGPMIPSSSPSR